MDECQQAGCDKSTPDGFESWNAYWTAQGMPWRTEPEIDEERQQYLAERRAISPDFKRGIYPFKDVRLTRADVEWLLATHRSGEAIGPVDWFDMNQRQRIGLDLRGADLRGVNLAADDRIAHAPGLPLSCMRAGLSLPEWLNATPEQREIAAAHLENADLRRAHLERADLRMTYLTEAALVKAHLEEANLTAARCDQADFRLVHLEDAYLRWAHVSGTDLRGAYLGNGTRMDDIVLNDKTRGAAWLSDVHWNGANLTVIDWSNLCTLGDEGTRRWWWRTREEAERATRANAQLAKELRDVGMNDDADHFAYRARVRQRGVHLLRGRLLRWLFSWLLFVVAGYGYRPLRTLFWYFATIASFALAYYWTTRGVITFGLHPSQFHPLAWYEALVLSVSSFHGRGFLPFPNLGDPVTILAAIEAMFGLFIEVSFIATFTQRYFGK